MPRMKTGGIKTSKPVAVKSGPAKPIKIDANFGGREVGGPSATSPSSQFHTFSGSVHGFKSSYGGDHGHPVEGAKYASHGVSEQWIKDRVERSGANSERLGRFDGKLTAMAHRLQKAWKSLPREENGERSQRSRKMERQEIKTGGAGYAGYKRHEKNLWNRGWTAREEYSEAKKKAMEKEQARRVRVSTSPTSTGATAAPTPAPSASEGNWMRGPHGGIYKLVNGKKVYR